MCDVGDPPACLSDGNFGAPPMQASASQCKAVVWRGCGMSWEPRGMRELR